MKTPILETERLIIRPLAVTDAEEIFTNWTSDREVTKFMTYTTHENVEVTKAWLADVETKTLSDTAYDWAFIRKCDNKIIGSGGIYYREDQGCFELGYNIMKACWHQGYTSEAAAGILKFAVETLGETKFFARHEKRNPNSGKVMEKVGFHYIGDSESDSLDGSKHFENREYILEIPTLYLKEANLADAEQEYLFFAQLPADENGFTNPDCGASKEEYMRSVLPKMINYSKGIDLPENFVPETFFFLWNDREIIGEFRIRHELTEALRTGSGHIGYGIKKEYRGKGYASKGLALTIEKAKGIIKENEIYMSVNKDNPASLKVQIKNGAHIHHEDEKKYYTRLKIR